MYTHVLYLYIYICLDSVCDTTPPHTPHPSNMVPFLGEYNNEPCQNRIASYMYTCTYGHRRANQPSGRWCFYLSGMPPPEAWRLPWVKLQYMYMLTHVHM